MNDFFRKLFAYNHHVNQKLGDVLDANIEKIPEKTIKLYSHIINAHQIWNNRINPSEHPLGVWEIHSFGDCYHIDKLSYAHSLQIIDSLDLNSAIPGLQVRGKTFNKTAGEILFHIINHSTYHRGQIAADLRQSGIEPLPTDYFLYGE
ncbi:MAG: DinB family protein [Chitinophagaceae bacterium]